MFEADPNEKLAAPAEAKVKPSRPPPPAGPPSGIPAGKPLPPKTLPPSVKAAPRPMRPPPGKGRAPPPEEMEETATNLKKHPPETEPPFKRGFKKPKVEEVVIVRRRDKDHPEFEESSSDEEEEGAAKSKIAVKKEEGAAPMEEAEQQDPAADAKDAAQTPDVAAKDAAQTPAAAAVITTPEKTAPAAKSTPEAPGSKPPSRPSSEAAKPSDTTPDKLPSRPPSAVPDKPPSRPPSAVLGSADATGRPPSVMSEAPASSVSDQDRRSSLMDENASEMSESVASQLIVAPPPGIVIHKDPNAAVAMQEGVGKFVPPVALNIEGMESHLSKEIKGGRLNVTCLNGIGLKKREDKSKNPRVDPYIRFKLGAADKWPWKVTTVQRKQESNADFAEELVSFDVVKPSQFIYQEDIQLVIEVWNKGTFKDEIIGTVTMSVVRFFKNPFKAYTEKVPIVAPGDRTSTSKIVLEFLFEEARAGLFVFTLYEAKRLRNVDPMGQQHPYVQMALGDYKKKSRVVEKGGRDPYFAEEDIIMWVDTESWVNDLDVMLCDQEVGEDNPIAYTDLCLLPYMDILPMAAKEDNFDLFYKPHKEEPDEIAQGALSMKVTYLPAGTLHVNVVRGKGLLPKGKQTPMDGESFRIDPFVNFTLNSQAAKMSKKCPVDKDGGTDPVWQHQLNFDVVDQYLMDVDCYHQNIQGDDELIGSAQVSLLTVFKAGIQNLWVTLKQSKPEGGVRECGDINIQMHFVGPPAIAFPQYRPGVETFDDALRQSPPDESDDVKVKKDDSDLVAGILAGGEKSDFAKQEFTDEEIENAFKFIDLDKNNFIGAAEIRHILVCMGELITDEEIDMMIAMVDLDGDGQVSFDEFRKLVLHPDPARMDKDDAINDDALEAIEKEKLVMAGRANEVDSATFQRQKEMQARDMKKRMILNFLNDHEYDFDSLQLSYNRYLGLPKEHRIQGRITFDQFCTILQIDPINENNRLFGLFDPERTGKVDLREFLLGCFNFVDLSREVRLPLTFQMYDEDKTGYISIKEVRLMLQGNHMLSLASVEKKAQTMMRQAVANESNAITVKEFLIVTKKFPNIIIPNLNTAKKD